MTERPDNLATALSGRYEILQELGAGGMATVYLAHDVRHDRNVALKVLRPDLATTLGPDRFLFSDLLEPYGAPAPLSVSGRPTSRNPIRFTRPS